MAISTRNGACTICHIPVMQHLDEHKRWIPCAQLRLEPVPCVICNHPVKDGYRVHLECLDRSALHLLK